MESFVTNHGVVRDILRIITSRVELQQINPEQERVRERQREKGRERHPHTHTHTHTRTHAYSQTYTYVVQTHIRMLKSGDELQRINGEKERARA